MIFLKLEDLLQIAERTLGVPAVVRDVGLLESALARPQASVFGEDAYPTLHEKAAALLHSVARNHALVDGNKRLALAAILAFFRYNGARLVLAEGEAYDLVMAVATGELDDVAEIAARLRTVDYP
jgi:death on curing protein